jgi:hypothetical protein
VTHKKPILMDVAQTEAIHVAVMKKNEMLMTPTKPGERQVTITETNEEEYEDSVSNGGGKKVGGHNIAQF